jgi:hypothetical protein
MSLRTVRRPQPRRIDVRLLIGIALVAASIGGVWAVVASADRSVPVYAAATAIVPGESIDVDDLVVRRVSLGEADGRYLVPGGVPDEAVATRTVLAGELVPLDAIGRSADVARASVVVSITDELPSEVAAGSDVDLWAVGASDAGQEAPPSVLVEGAIVTQVLEDDGLVSGTTEISVELSIPDGTVAIVLTAKAAGDQLALVPSAGGSR